MGKIDYNRGNHQISGRYFFTDFDRPAVIPTENVLAAKGIGNAVRVQNLPSTTIIFSGPPCCSTVRLGGTDHSDSHAISIALQAGLLRYINEFFVSRIAIKSIPVARSGFIRQFPLRHRICQGGAVHKKEIHQAVRVEIQASHTPCHGFDHASEVCGKPGVEIGYQLGLQYLKKLEAIETH